VVSVRVGLVGWRRVGLVGWCRVVLGGVESCWVVSSRVGWCRVVLGGVESCWPVSAHVGPCRPCRPDIKPTHSAHETKKMAKLAIRRHNG
jgi:hypothetical protein